MSDPVAVTLRLYGRSRRSYDVDNYFKAVGDLLQGSVLVDDCQIQRLEVQRGEIVKGGAAWITVESWTDPPVSFPGDLGPPA